MTKMLQLFRFHFDKFLCLFPSLFMACPTYDIYMNENLIRLSRIKTVSVLSTMKKQVLLSRRTSQRRLSLSVWKGPRRKRCTPARPMPSSLTQLKHKSQTWGSWTTFLKRWMSLYRMKVVKDSVYTESQLQCSL